MTTYWTNTPQSWPADDPLHAHITRKALQDNLQTVYGDDSYPNSGFDYDIYPFTGTDINSAITSSWAWLADFPPFPIPVCRAQGGGWRKYKVETYAKVASETGTLRVFMLDTKTVHVIDATSGEVAGVTSYVDIALTSAYARTNDTITLQRIGRTLVDGVSLDLVWVHLAIKHVSGPSTGYLQALHMTEKV